MRLIDADALVKDLNTIWFKDRGNCLDVFSCVKDAPTIGGWVSVTERLPEEEGWYLVTIQNDKTRKRRTENDLFAIGIAEAHKHTPYKFCKDGYRQTVIAWMQLPEPYKEERDE